MKDDARRFSDEAGKDNPAVSVLVANYNGEDFIAHALDSALRSSLESMEVLVADDCSSDASAEIVAEFASKDSRVRWLPSAVNGGPGAARNRAIAAARGRWLAILDSDDMIHPDRFARLIDFAERTGAELVADDLLIFDDANETPPYRFLDRPECNAPFEVTADLYLEQTVLYGRKPNLGFLKPIILRSALDKWQIRYDEKLRIAEDDDLITRCLAVGMKYRVDPQIGYFYRQHGTSITKKLGPEERSAIRNAAARVEDRLQPVIRKPSNLRRRTAAIDAADVYHSFAESVRRGTALGSLGALLVKPRALGLLRHPLIARWKRLKSAIRKPKRFESDERRNVLFISRQRLLGAQNGSSAYLLDIAKAIRDAGMVPHLIQPSPVITGRYPFIRLKPEMGVFESHLVRGLWRLGNVFVSPSPRTWTRAVIGQLSRMLRKLGLPAPADRPLGHSISQPWRDEDYLYVASHARERADALILDYIFQTEAIPFVLRPDAPSAILIHDLYNMRAENFAERGLADEVAEKAKGEEAERIARAHAAIAIQKDEGAWISEHVPSTQVIVAPMAAQAVSSPQPGNDHHLLFVGSSAAPNVSALAWFLDNVWPEVLKAAPHSELKVAGRVGEAFPKAPSRVRFLGVVPDLEPLYREAGVVISPLLVGSGLKIKLIEALARGKAIVATAATLQGVEDIAGDAVKVAETAESFATAVVSFLQSRSEREEFAGRALSVATQHFSSRTCYDSILNFLSKPAQIGPDREKYLAQRSYCLTAGEMRSARD